MQAQLLMIYFTDLSNLFITRINTKLSTEPLQLAERSLGNCLSHGQCKRFNTDTVFRAVRSTKASFPISQTDNNFAMGMELFYVEWKTVT